MDKRRLSVNVHIPYSYKLMVPYLLLVLLTDLWIGFYSYSSLIQSRTEMAETNLRTSLQQTRSQFEFQMGEIQRISNSLFKDRSFNQSLETQGNSHEIFLVMLDRIIPSLESPLQQFGNRIQLAIYPLNPAIMKVYGNDLLQKPIKNSDYFIVPADEVKNTDWYAALVSGGMDGRWVQIEADRKLGNISYVHRLISYQDYQTVIGYVRIVIRLDDLLSNFDAFPLDQGISLSLVDDSTGITLYQRGEEIRNTRDTPLILKEMIPGTTFFIKVTVPEAYLNKDSRELQKRIAAVCTVSFLIMTAIGLFVARLSGRNMRHIVKQIHSFQQGDFGKRIRISENDEFGQIAEAFNAMAGNIQELIDSVYREGLRKKQAELEALQAQINPHFLYNTLSSIISLANMGEIPKVTDMVRKLTLFYRLSLNEGEVEIALEKELEQVKAYIDIQRTKYEDAFTVCYDIEPDILSCSVIKLILQPFVENIFKHAWFGESIAVVIRGRRTGDQIELKVIDNGIGIHRGVQQVHEAGQRAGGCGVKNVDERIKLRYGKEYGVSIASIYGAGTTARILLPAVISTRDNPRPDHQTWKGEEEHGLQRSAGRR
ncbi:sensor histidine kinase [Paenibacillus alkalitolerans]|uniref:sensor histidine kinase n=1 Tax=Paenibacillus alkalitolerans TaxID=2799335 RepID=UPI0018F6369D|nr:histidine kinase [Paenibacillus alkalitolerans]